MEFENFINNDNIKITEGEAKNHNVLVFAFVGDAVFTLFVRDYFACSSTFKAGVLHTTTSKYVKASFQAKLYDLLENSLLNDYEKTLGKSARNAHTNNIAKNASVDDYKKATSFEAVLGYLYMTKQNERLMQILNFCQQQF